MSGVYTQACQLGWQANDCELKLEKVKTKQKQTICQNFGTKSSPFTQQLDAKTLTLNSNSKYTP